MIAWAGKSNASTPSTVAASSSVAINGNDAAAHHWYSHYFTAIGSPVEWFEQSRIALELDPLDIQISAHMIFHYARARDFSSAIQAGLQTLELDPHSQLANLFLSWVFEATGKWDKAVHALQRSLCANMTETLLVS
jgi:tetratricopeptide (TPR) repeat protein